MYEDERMKSGVVTDLIEKEFPSYEIDVEASLKDAKNKIKKNKYHMIIADLKTPITRSEAESNKDSGITFLEHIFESEGENFYRPDEVVILTQYADDMEIMQSIKRFPVAVLKYHEREDEWRHDLINRIYDCNRKYNNKMDVAVITAVSVEFDAFHQNYDWKQIEIENDSNLYFSTEYSNQSGEKIKVLLTMLPLMGMVPAADITHRIIHQFNPSYVIMSGICGGNKKDVSAGDIVIAEKAWDYGSGSMEEIVDENGTKMIRFVPAPEQISIDKMLLKEFKKYSLDSDLAIRIRKQCKMSKFNKDIKIVIGGMATGAAVIKNEEFVNKYIAPSHRKYKGIDMETYGMYYAAEHFANTEIKFISIKSVSDGADASKSDEFQEYCSRLAANLTNYFIENYIFIH